MFSSSTLVIRTHKITGANTTQNWWKNRSKPVTSRERPKLALYLRLKKREVFKILKRWTFWAFRNSSLFQSMKKGSPLETLKIFPVTKKFEKMSHSAEKKLEMSNFGPLLCFPGRPFVSFFVLHRVLRIRVF